MRSNAIIIEIALFDPDRPRTRNIVEQSGTNPKITRHSFCALQCWDDDHCRIDGADDVVHPHLCRATYSATSNSATVARIASNKYALGRRRRSRPSDTTSGQGFAQHAFPAAAKSSEP